MKCVVCKERDAEIYVTRKEEWICRECHNKRLSSHIS